MDVKCATTYEQQIELMKCRGCKIEDERQALDVLQRVNYYRFTAYFLPFKTGEDKYREGTTFQKVYRIYDFDRRLRSLLFMSIERIELRLRTQIAYHHAHRYGPTGYLCAESFNKKHDHERFIHHIEEDIKRNRQQPFVAHHVDKYDGMFPIWVIIELFTAGEISIFYADMPRADKKKIAKEMFGTTDENLRSWLICFTKIRNYCAHYSRLYYNKFGTVPATPDELPFKLQDRVFDYMMVLKFLYPGQESWRRDVLTPFAALLTEYGDAIEMQHLGLPEDYIKHLG